MLPPEATSTRVAQELERRGYETSCLIGYLVERKIYLMGEHAYEELAALPRVLRRSQWVKVVSRRLEISLGTDTLDAGGRNLRTTKRTA
jgi:hypothetical protein